MLDCATTLGSEWLAKKFKDSFDAKKAEQAAGEPARVREWAALYRPWYLRREPLLGALANGCDVAGPGAFSGACAPFKAAWEKTQGARGFACKVFAVVGRDGGDSVLCDVDGRRVLLDLPAASRSTLDGGLRQLVESEGLAKALGAPSVAASSEVLPPFTTPAVIEIRAFTRLRRHARAEGLLDRTFVALDTLGARPALAARLLGQGDVWEVGVGAEGKVALVQRGDPQAPVIAASTDRLPAATAPDDCSARVGRWDQAFCELGRLPAWATEDLSSPIPLTRSSGTIRVGAPNRLSPDAYAYRRPVVRERGAELFVAKVEQRGGFATLACSLTDVVKASTPRIDPDRRAMAEVAGVEESALEEFLLTCVGDAETTTEPVVVHLPSHAILARGSIPPEFAQRGAVRVDAYLAEPTRLLGAKLAGLRTADPPFIDLARKAKLAVKGYSKLWRDGKSGPWHVAFDPECRDDGFGCELDDGLGPSVELVSGEACGVSGFTYP